MSEILDSSQTNAVRDRYAKASQVREAALCCPVDYDSRYLKAIPQEVIERDYGCGDPSRYVKPGETVLDLGSGTGKICFIASQVVGEGGRVIGVDMTDDMLEVARRNAPTVAQNIGYGNVEFRKGSIQDLSLDLEALEASLSEKPIRNANDFLEMSSRLDELKKAKPLIADESVDVVVSNCVLNLVDSAEKPALFGEVIRVLKKGGRAVISDIVSDKEVPLSMQKDAELWSGCISGAMTEEGFLKAFADAGFTGIRFLKFETDVWQTVEGIEFRSVTVEAFRPSASEGVGPDQVAVYNGPFKKVLDDEGNAYERGKRYAVTSQRAAEYSKDPYAGAFTVLNAIGEKATFSAGTEFVKPDAAATSDCCSSEGSKCC